MFKKSLAVILMAIPMLTTTSFGNVSANNSVNTIQIPTKVYRVEKMPSGNLRVQVQVDIENKIEREQYAEQQRQFALDLAKVAHGNVPVQVTFKQPLSVEELQVLAEKTDLAVELATLEMRDAQNGLHTAGVLIEDLNSFDFANLPAGPEGYSLKVIGVMVVRGAVTASRLADLALDERVYLPDVMPYLLTVELAQQYQNISTEQIQVDAPSPHWFLSEERVSNVSNQILPKVYLPIITSR